MRNYRTVVRNYRTIEEVVGKDQWNAVCAQVASEDKCINMLLDEIEAMLKVGWDREQAFTYTMRLIDRLAAGLPNE